MENKAPVSGYGPPVPGSEHQMGVMSPHPTGQPMVAPPGYVQQQPMDPAQSPQPQQYQQQQPQQPQYPPQDPQLVQQQVYGAQASGMYGVPLVSLAAQASPVQCPHCQHRGMTSVAYESGGFTHLMALLACCVVCLGCIPYMVSSLKDVHHKCSQCGTPLATYHRSGRTEVHYQPAAVQQAPAPVQSPAPAQPAPTQ